MIKVNIYQLSEFREWVRYPVHDDIVRIEARQDSRESENQVRPSPLTVRICLCASIVVLGLSLRRYGFGLGLPGMIVKYGGSSLWGAMVYFLVAIAAPRLPRWTVASISTLIAICVELSRLAHTPMLDRFRLTLTGALLLGRIFSAWDIIAYVAGIAFAFALDLISLASFASKSPPHSAS